ncbi:hypothetical protein ABT360_33355, partial [Streptomyces sp. NPDC000229]
RLPDQSVYGPPPHSHTSFTETDTAPKELPEQESGIGIPDAAYEMIKEGIDGLVANLPDPQRQVITPCVLQDMSPEHAEEAPWPWEDGEALHSRSH